MRRPAFLAAATALLAAATSLALAHDFCLLPATARVEPGRPVPIFMHVAERFPGETVPWRTEKVVELFITDVNGRSDIEDAAPAGDPAAAQIRFRSAGTSIVSLVTSPSYITIEAGPFEDYLKHEGHEAVREARRRAGKSEAAGRERYTRHVKTIVNAAGPSASVALSRVGLEIEIVPEAPLARLQPGDKLPVRVYYHGGPESDGQVCATDASWAGGDDTYAWCGRLDGAGRASIPIRAAGWQMIRATHMIPVRDDPQADWQSFWASLTFEVEGAPPQESKP